MQKRGLIILILIASISFVSAQMGIGEFLDAFGGENLLLIGSFIISFVLINFILGRLPVFKHKSKEYPYKEKRNKVVPGVIAFIISLFIIYGINNLDFNITNFFSNFGVGEGMLETIAIIAILAALIFLFWKFKSLVILFLGLILIGISLTDLVYEKDTVLFIGLALVIIWILIKIFYRKKKDEDEEEFPSEGPISDKDRKKAIRNEQEYRKKVKELEQKRKQERTKTAQKLKRSKTTRKEANFYLSFRQGDELIFNPGENAKVFRMGNKGGGKIKWNAHAIPTQLIKVSPNKGIFKAGQIIDGIIRINRRAILPGTTKPATAAIGIHTLDRKRNRATFSAKIKIY